MVALLVPACGGGGEGQDYYVSVQQFESTAKGFRIIASSDVIVSNASGGGYGNYGDDRHQAMEGFMEEIEANGVRKDLPFDPDKKHTSTVVPGVCDMGGTKTNVTIAYWVEEENYGYMYITFQTPDGSAPKVIASVLGCMTPSDIIALNGKDMDLTVVIDQKILVSTVGCVMHIRFDFNSGVADVGLAYTDAKLIDDDAPISEKVAIKVKRHYLVVNHN